MQLPAHARLEVAVGRFAGGTGGNGRRVLGMEVAAPVDVVAQEFDDELFQQGVVFAIRAEETRVDGR